MGVERWPVDRLVACAAGPGGVSAAAKAGLMPDEHFAGAEGVAVRASCRWVDDPLPAVVCTSSPSTITSLFRPNVRSSPGHLSDIGQRPSGVGLAG